jgi:hypothetical protein
MWAACALLHVFLHVFLHAFLKECKRRRESWHSQLCN